jgi:hypothetical protein
MVNMMNTRKYYTLLSVTPATKAIMKMTETVKNKAMRGGTENKARKMAARRNKFANSS